MKKRRTIMEIKRGERKEREQNVYPTDGYFKNIFNKCKYRKRHGTNIIFNYINKFNKITNLSFVDIHY